MKISFPSPLTSAVEVTFPLAEMLLSFAIDVAVLIVSKPETDMSSETVAAALMLRFLETISFSVTLAFVLFKIRFTYCLPFALLLSLSQTKLVVESLPVYSIVGSASVSLPLLVSQPPVI